jgi:hypothetical protein
MLRIRNGLEKKSDEALISKARNVISGMTDNSSFTTPTPTLAVVQAAVDAFTNALDVAQSGGTYEKAFKNQKRQEVIDLMHSLANYVLFIANGDKLVAQSSNFTIAKDPSPAPDVTPALNLELRDGFNSGEMYLKFDRVPGSRSYVYQITQHPLTDASVWKSITGTVKRATFSNLEVGKRYVARVMAIGINGQGVYSQTVSRIAQ